MSIQTEWQAETALFYGASTTPVQEILDKNVYLAQYNYDEARRLLGKANNAPDKHLRSAFRSRAMRRLNQTRKTLRLNLQAQKEGVIRVR